MHLLKQEGQAVMISKFSACSLRSALRTDHGNSLTVRFGVDHLLLVAFVQLTVSAFKHTLDRLDETVRLVCSVLIVLVGLETIDALELQSVVNVLYLFHGGSSFKCYTAA